MITLQGKHLLGPLCFLEQSCISSVDIHQPARSEIGLAVIQCLKYNNQETFYESLCLPHLGLELPGLYHEVLLLLLVSHSTNTMSK